jgi:hypothetical protein
VQIMDLVGGNQRSLKQRQSNLREYAFLRCSRRPVFALHYAVLGGRRVEADSVHHSLVSLPASVYGPTQSASCSCIDLHQTRCIFFTSSAELPFVAR